MHASCVLLSRTDGTFSTCWQLYSSCLVLLTGRFLQFQYHSQLPSIPILQKPYGYFENMELARAGNHHAALTRNLSLGPLNDAYHSTRHDPMRLPDAHLQQASATVGAVSQERERFDRSRNNDDVSQWYERPRLERVGDLRRAYPIQEPMEGEEFRPKPMRRAETMPPQLNASQLNANARRERERDSTRKPQKSSGLRRTENFGSLPTPEEVFRPEDLGANARARRERESTRKSRKSSGLGMTESPDSSPSPTTTPEPIIYRERPKSSSYDYEAATSNGYGTELHEPVPAAGSRKVTRSPSPIKAEREKEYRGPRTTSYVYGAQGLQDVSASRSTLDRNNAPEQLYGEIPTASRSSPRQTRTEYHFPRPNIEEVGNVLERRAMPSTTLSSQQRLELVCPTVSRDDTSSEDSKISSLVKTAMEPHLRKAQMSKVSGSDTSGLLPPEKTPITRRSGEVRPQYARNPSWQEPAYARNPSHKSQAAY
jgi:hypothetical protein